MATLSENIKRYRKQSGLTQKELAFKLGIVPTSISAWEVGRNKPLMDNIEMMAKIFNVKKSDLLGDDLEIIKQTLTSPLPDSVSKLNKELNKENHAHWVGYGNDLLDKQNGISEESADYNSDKITKLHKPEKEYEYLVVHGLESAGDGIWQEDDADIEVRIPKDKIPEQFDDLAMVIGDSMHPRLHNGDILFITFTKQIENGEIGVFRTSKGNFVKKKQADRLESLNPDYDDVYFTEDEYAEAVGVVVDVYRK